MGSLVLNVPNTDTVMSTQNTKYTTVSVDYIIFYKIVNLIFTITLKAYIIRDKVISKTNMKSKIFYTFLYHDRVKLLILTTLFIQTCAHQCCSR